jgi:tetratricopeptide (TPR) repeat protein
MLLAEIPDRLPEAIAEYQAALGIRPDFADAHFNLGNALSQIPGRLPEAIAEYRAAIRTRPDYAGLASERMRLLRASPPSPRE